MRSRALAALSVLALVGSGCSIEAVERVVDAAQDDPEAVEIEQDDSPAPRSPLSEIVAAALPSVVNVKVITPGPVGLGRGEGSGVVIDETGIILTNFHVVECSANVEIAFNDEHGKLKGTVVGGIQEKDLAVIRVEADDLTPIEIGSSSGLAPRRRRGRDRLPPRARGQPDGHQGHRLGARPQDRSEWWSYR